MSGGLSAQGSTGRPPAPPLSRLHFSTHDLPPHEQFTAWRERSASWIEVSRPGVAETAPFLAQHSLWNLGPFAISASHGEGVVNRRTVQQIRRDQMDHFVINVLRRGQFHGRTRGIDFGMTTTAPCVFSMEQPADAERNDADWLMLFLPRDAIADAAPAADAVLGRSLDSSLGRLLQAHLNELANELPTLAACDAARAADVTLALVRAAVTGMATHLDAVEHLRENMVRSQVMALIRRHVGSSRLDPGRLARLAGMSRTQLYRVFESEGGVACVILAERLHAVRRALANPTERRTIGRIAEEFGMPDPRYSRGRSAVSST